MNLKAFPGFLIFTPKARDDFFESSGYTINPSTLKDFNTYRLPESDKKNGRGGHRTTFNLRYNC